MRRDMFFLRCKVTSVVVLPVYHSHCGPLAENGVSAGVFVVVLGIWFRSSDDVVGKSTSVIN